MILKKGRAKSENNNAGEPVSLAKAIEIQKTLATIEKESDETFSLCSAKRSVVFLKNNNIIVYYQVFHFNKRSVTEFNCMTMFHRGYH